MTTVICKNEKCPYRSKRPLRKWVFNNIDGTTRPCYGCTLESVTINEIFDTDGDVSSLYGYVPAECEQYKQHKKLTMVSDEELLFEED